mgnify:CR=1 FL=1
MESYKIKVKVFIQPSWWKSHRHIEIDLFEDKLDTIKQKILANIRASSKKIENFEFSLNYLNLQVPLVNNDDFNMMMVDILQNPEEMVIINVKRITQKRIKRQFSYDELGTIAPTLDNEGDITLNRPSDKMYTGHEEVICAFCRTSNKDKAAIKVLGPFYGPFRSKSKLFYVHELCAIWTPWIYLDDKNKMKNVMKEIKRCAKLQCSYCGIYGGGLGCKQPGGCKNTYHFKCALNDDLDCQLFYDEFTLLCPEHAEKIEGEEDEIDLDNLICKACGEGNDDDKLLICDKCLGGYHTYCLNPPLEEIPDGEWFCHHCRDVESGKERGSPTI